MYLPLGLSKKDSPTLVMHKARGSQPCVTPNQNSTPLHNQIKSKFLPIYQSSFKLIYNFAYPCSGTPRLRTSALNHYRKLIWKINLKTNLKNKILIFVSGVKPQDGVPDMTVISDIDEFGINENLHVRYKKDNIYVGNFIRFIQYFINYNRFLMLNENIVKIVIGNFHNFYRIICKLDFLCRTKITKRYLLCCPSVTYLFYVGGRFA